MKSVVESGVPGSIPGLGRNLQKATLPNISQPPVTLVFHMIFPTEEWNISHLRNRKWITKKKYSKGTKEVQ